MGGYCEIDTGGSAEVRLRTGPSDRQKQWVVRGDHWVPTYVAGPSRSCYLHLTNVSERKLILHGDMKIAMWLAADRVPRLPGYVSVGSRRYAKWQNLAYQTTTGGNGMTPKQEEAQGPAVERPLCPTPTSILRRPPTCPLGTATASPINKDWNHDANSLCNDQELQLPSGEVSRTQIATSQTPGAPSKFDICSTHVVQNQGPGTSDPDQRLNTSTKQRKDDQGQRDKWTRATKAFVTLKDKIVNAPILTHFDPDKRPLVILYASKWAISAALVQEYDGVYQPVTFTSGTLQPNDINDSIVDKEVLALLRMLDVCYTQLVTRSIKGEDEILGVIAASITPREEVDSILTSIPLRKQPKQVISMPPPTVEPDEEPLVVSFDGSARVKRTGAAFSAIVWSLPNWTVISGASEYKTSLTVNEAENHWCRRCEWNGYVGRKTKKKWIIDLKKYLTVDVRELTSTEAKSCVKIVEDYEMDEARLLFSCPPSKQSYEDRDLMTRLVIPEPLQEDVLHHYHSSLEGDTKVSDERESSGNLQATYPLQIIAMDHIPSLPKSYKGNTELLIWIDLFTGYVIAKASASRTVQTIAENYEECVFRRFGASEMIRHDREPGFMADFFRSFNKIVG
ncbi:unnamed protein product [Phytophthora fragariaefolia]|uniref:Unnamed protein product n=1 Tax=Phytophthora fragariaefolia TaxID=1490495 RepID=A0A9W6YP98_9STRA|nr:unnamed protein product [Phytophthora fragariaefolia]